MATEILRPNGAGDETNLNRQGSPVAPSNWESVDEVSADGLTTYVRGNELVTYVRDLYAVENHSADSGSISKITVYASCAAANGVPNQASIKIAVKSGSTVDESSELTGAGSETFELFSQEWATNPDTSSAWSWAEIDSLQIGISLRSPQTGAMWDTVLTQIYVEVTYSAETLAVTIQAITNIVTTTARGHGNVTDIGIGTISQHGHVARIGAEPDIDNYDVKTELGTKAATGTFVSELTVLTAGQTYHVRAYATSEYGTVYSSELSFVAGTAGAQSYPVDAQTRVTSLIHRYGRGIYILELLLGEVTADFGLPEPVSKPQPALPEGEVPEAIAPPWIRPELREQAIGETEEELAQRKEAFRREEDQRLRVSARTTEDQARIEEEAREWERKQRAEEFRRLEDERLRRGR